MPFHTPDSAGGAQQNPEEVVLRAYNKADFPALFALDQECFAPGIAYSAGELKYFLAHPRCFTIVAEIERQVVGFCLAEQLRESGQRAGHLITIETASHARRAGVGTQLLSEAERRLEAAGVSVLRLEVAINNHGAQSFYERHGFTIHGRIPGYYAGKIDAFTMAKPLTSKPAQAAL